jgi:excisionase family DNA binding protein
MFFAVPADRPEQKGTQPMSLSRVEATSQRVGAGRPIVASVNETMTALSIGREKIYQLLNSGELESYRDGGSRKILWRGIEAYVERRLAEEAKRRGGAA